MIAFGVGSLWFGIKGDQIEVGADHLAAIQSSLEAIPNLKDVELTKPHLLAWAVREIGEGGDDDIHPIYPGVEIKFGLYLPTRIQNQLMPISRSLTEVENFDVIIRYGYQGCLAFVSYEDVGGKSNPSHGVIVVRKYLEQEFEKSSAGVTFETLGPSPYHCDFWLEAGEDEQADLFKVLKIPTAKGYGEIIFRYRAKDFTSITEAWCSLLEYVQESAEIYYGAVVIRNAILQHTLAVSNSLDNLLELHRDRGIFSGMVRLFKSPGTNRDLLISLLEAEKARLSGNRFLSEAQRKSQPEHNLPFNAAAREVLEDGDHALPVSQIGETVRLFEGRNLSNLASAAVLVAGLFGGAVGALVASLLR